MNFKKRAKGLKYLLEKTLKSKVNNMKYIDKYLKDRVSIGEEYEIKELLKDD